LIDALSSAGAGWVVGKAADLGVRVVQGSKEERTLRRVVRGALNATLERYYDEATDQQVWSSFLEQFLTDSLACALILRAVFRQERPDTSEVRQALAGIGFHTDELPFEFHDFLSEFTAHLADDAQEEARGDGSALANWATQEKLDYVVREIKVLRSAVAAGREDRENGAVAIAVRSFTRWAEGMEDETDLLLPLETYFDGRRIREPSLWHKAVYPEVERFLMGNMRGGEPYHLHLSAHVSIAFACGYVLDPKSNVRVAPVQRTPSGPELWRPESGWNAPFERVWDFAPLPLEGSHGDVAVVIGVTLPILEDVRAYVDRELPQVERILAFTVLPEPARSSVRSGAHGWRLAEDLAQKIHTARTAEEREATLHVFAAAPTGLMFFLGRLSRGFGRCVLYEYDFESNAPGAYSPSLVFPPPTTPQATRKEQSLSEA
jgi:hypothetical protein